MSEKISVNKILATVSLIGLLLYGFTFSAYKAINEYVDYYVFEIIDFLALWGINVSVEQFWIALAIMFLVAMVLVITKSD